MVMGNPYRIEGPALISFSGGRTSAYMLWHILDAHDGKLPDDVHVCFANTGKEREETLRFVHECGSRWGVRVRWLEWRARPLGKAGRKTPASDRFEEVGYNSASRSGEPFNALIRRKKYLPNVTERFCTAELKIDTLKQFMLSIRFKRWDNIIGLRADELRRIAKSSARNDAGKERWTNRWPMLKAGISQRDVWRFWLGDNVDPKNLTAPLPQGFDLGLYPYEGNCDGCFLKGRAILMWQERERPGTLGWWAEAEAEASRLTARDRARFIKDDSYAAMIADVERQPLLVPIDWRDLEFDAECGVSGSDARIRCGARAP
jgi:3'-phosphoadenosine 5'-phosphosulfate sulfotransferase (PAPS reductase)/FAD synthetase